jgi:hypothetical protein
LTSLPFAVGHEKRWTHFGLAIAKTGRSIQAALELVSGERLCNSLRGISNRVGDGLPRERTGEKQAKNRWCLKFCVSEDSGSSGGLVGRWLDITHFAELIGKNAIQFCRQPCYL